MLLVEKLLCLSTDFFFFGRSSHISISTLKKFLAKGKLGSLLLTPDKNSPLRVQTTLLLIWLYRLFTVQTEHASVAYVVLWFKHDYVSHHDSL